jgi:2-polyprenyl-6-methoxyphenol hydroxylase-like FAD-dependent oxidoreductase
MFRDNPEVLVVGAGPVGLASALALAKRGVRVEIVDTGVWPCKHSYALALHPESLKLFAAMGLREQALAGSYPVRKVGLWDREQRRAAVDLSEGVDPDACLAVLRQDAIENHLERALKDLGVEVRWRHEVSRLEPSGDMVKATVDKLERQSRGYIVAHAEWMVAKSAELEVPYVIGADGHSSRVRHALRLDFPEVGRAQYFAVFELKTDADLANEVRVVLGPETTDILWPLPGGFCRWSFELPGYADPDAERMKDQLLRSGFGYFPTERLKDRLTASEPGNYPILDEENLRAFIAERAPWFTSKIELITWRTVVRFERRLASAFGKGRMWLAGDAAHLTGPGGVQSMNLGLLEGRELAEILTRRLRGGAMAGELDAYGERWQREWRKLHGLDSKMKATPKADPWVAAHAEQILSCLPAHGLELDSFAGQLGLTL